MNAQTEAPRPTPTIKKRARKPSAPRAPRVVDPAIAAINETARQQRAQHRKSGVSARILRVIIEKRLAQMTAADHEALFDFLKHRITAPLPMDLDAAELKAK